MRRFPVRACAVIAALVLAGCGSSSKPKKRAAIGPTFPETLAAAKDSASRSTLLRYATGRKEAATQELARLQALQAALLAPPPTIAPGPPAGTQPSQPPDGGRWQPPAQPKPPVSGDPGPPPMGPSLDEMSGKPMGPGTGLPPPPGPVIGKLPGTGVMPGTQSGVNPGGTPAGPGVGTSAPPVSGNLAPLPPGMTPARLTELMTKASMELALWSSLIAELDKGRPSKSYVVKDWKAGNEGKDQATSQLAVSLAGPYAGLAEGDLNFELVWRRVTRPPASPGDAPRADWELGDTRVVKESSDK